MSLGHTQRLRLLQITTQEGLIAAKGRNLHYKHQRWTKRCVHRMGRKHMKRQYLMGGWGSVPLVGI